MGGKSKGSTTGRKVDMRLRLGVGQLCMRVIKDAFGEYIETIASSRMSPVSGAGDANVICFTCPLVLFPA